MIGSALNTIAEAVNEQLVKRHSADTETVMVSNLVNAEGAIVDSDSNKIILSLVNIQPEKVTQRGQVSNKGILNLNLYLLFASTFTEDQYTTGIDYISSIMTYFNSIKVLNHSNTPGLAPELEKLTFEIFPQDMQNISYLWGAIGAKQVPSILYKTRIVTLKEEGLDISAPITGLATRI